MEKDFLVDFSYVLSSYDNNCIIQILLRRESIENSYLIFEIVVKNQLLLSSIFYEEKNSIK